MPRINPLLEVKDLEMAHGDVQVLWGINMEVYSGEVVALIGSNGAGKSTSMAGIAGVLPLKGGEVKYRDRSLSQLRSEEIVGMGISLVPQGRNLFRGMSVMDNLLMGAYLRNDQEGIRADLEKVFSLFSRLKERENQLAGKLSGGEQQMCVIARGLMSRPCLLLIDELSLGLSPLLVEILFNSVQQIREEGTTIVLVEQDVELALENSVRAYVMEGGKIVNSGASRDLLFDSGIRRAYLGL